MKRVVGVHGFPVHWIILGLSAVAARGQAPTFSLEAVQINNAETPGGPVNRISVSPGDTITVKALLRDWSPAGEQLRGYQAEFDPASFSSGSEGRIAPVGYDDTRARQEQNPALFIDENDPAYIHRDMGRIPITDTVSSDGGRWLTVLLKPEEGPRSAQDGKKFYLGTAKLEVSADAKGTFTLAFVNDPMTTGLLDLNNEIINGIRWEPMIVEIRPGAVRLVVRESDPADGSIDARFPPAGSRGTSAGWDRVTLTFNADTANLSPGDFAIVDGTNNPPAIRNIVRDGMKATLEFDHGIAVQTWTKLIHTPSGSTIRLGYQPGDVNGDGSADAEDIAALIDTLAMRTTLPGSRTDVNHDNNVNAADLQRLIETVVSASARAKNRMRVPN